MLWAPVTYDSDARQRGVVVRFRSQPPDRYVNPGMAPRCSVTGMRSAFRVLTSILRADVRVAGLRQQPARNRRRPRHLVEPLKVGIPGAAGGLRCDRRRTTAGLALQAHLLLVPEDVELVARGGLPRQAQRDVGPGAVIDGASAQVGFVRPRVGIARRSCCNTSPTRRNA